MAWAQRSASMTDAGAGEAPALPRFGALGYPNYRRFWLANVARVFGMQFRFIGSGWLVTELTPSPVWLGIVGVASALPMIALSVPAGALADRMDSKRLLFWSQATTAAAMLAMAVLIVSGLVNLWIVVVWSAAVGAMMSLGNPSQNAILPRLIDKEAIPSAVAYTSGIWNVMGIVGPALAGVLIALIGTGQAFFVTAAGFGLSAVLIHTLRLTPLETKAHAAGGMLGGIRYIASNRLFAATIGLSFFTSLFGSSYMILLPNFARGVLGKGAQELGIMGAAIGVGALLGTISIVRLGQRKALGPIMLLSAAAFGLCIAAFAASRSMPMILFFLFTAGMTSSIYLNIGMTALQMLVPDELRGRVMGVWGMTWFLQAVGGLPAGALAAWVGTPLAITLGALSVSAFALALLVTVPSLRRMSATAPSAELARA
jgi:MFS family permease